MHAELFDSLQDHLRCQGAALVGVGDLRAFPAESRHGYPYGIAIAVPLNPAIVRQIATGPTKDYEAEYNRINGLLRELSEAGAAFLRQHGYEALPTPPTVLSDPLTYTTPFPHKTVATRAGLGWIGKCALFVTKDFGSAVRLTKIFMNAELPLGTAIDESLCGECQVCVDACPVHAPTGQNWRAGTPREDIYDVQACYRQTDIWMQERGIAHHICGICIAACPYTQQYLKRTE